MNPLLADALGKAARNAVQVLIPLLALVSAGTVTGADAGAVTVAAALAFILSLFKSALDWRAGADAPAVLKLLDRVLPAALGYLIGVWPLDLAGALSTDWPAVGLGTLGAAGTALAMWLLEILPAESAGLRRVA